MARHEAFLLFDWMYDYLARGLVRKMARSINVENRCCATTWYEDESKMKYLRLSNSLRQYSLLEVCFYCTMVRLLRTVRSSYMHVGKEWTTGA